MRINRPVGGSLERLLKQGAAGSRERTGYQGCFLWGHGLGRPLLRRGAARKALSSNQTGFVRDPWLPVVIARCRRHRGNPGIWPRVAQKPDGIIWRTIVKLAVHGRLLFIFTMIYSDMF